MPASRRCLYRAGETVVERLDTFGRAVDLVRAV